MSRVLIQPSYGNRIARDNWERTLDFPLSNEVVASVVPSHAARLIQTVHPEGSARYWGMVRHNAKVFDALATGDVVLFTGGSRVRAIAQVGSKFESDDFAGAFWHEAASGAFELVYSLTSFIEADIRLIRSEGVVV
ncbi:hypothetical protein, partial [Kytococcus sp. HMSC28H12]|uniref:hypothetical protein n=1 Tax=Kytococcus sp. HMSC28H12 TaxID=1581067 RepID=UPI00192CFA75